eukprot:CAMPEP_0181215740 /NCGR_PEP_ID=MMETSP1096-20121128/26181_1 /TAXON_ID=156174 ORGANISM="Chrysochromulina ericina, Strain CCMP281" /NCGR_SAMPLE_ID=MMETSP1096 /ASSEMBLY_ACC=CAM_ASM_000453 /LENGTH=113 /DNA_ID=CAMNT_0023307629 /DNA_START=211 /DNA_END=548 /DNA_ORIENTATION=+
MRAWQGSSGRKEGGRDQMLQLGQVVDLAHGLGTVLHSARSHTPRRASASAVGGGGDGPVDGKRGEVVEHGHRQVELHAPIRVKGVAPSRTIPIPAAVEQPAVSSLREDDHKTR